MKFKTILSLVLASALMVSMAACSPAGNSSTTTSSESNSSSNTTSDSVTTPAEPSDSDTPTVSIENFKVAMVTDVGGVNDESFNQSSWEGLEQFGSDMNASVKFLESQQEADYVPNLDRLVDEGQNLIWGVGFMLGDMVRDAAQRNPDTMYGVIDYSYPPEDGDNLVGVMFKAQEPSFLVGYIAGKTTQTGSVGFIGGMESELIGNFEYGYRAGVEYAAKELGKNIQVEIQYAESFNDDAKGKAIATQMYTNGCDIIFHAAGGTGKGLFEAAKEFNKLCIGVDQDQSNLAPDHTLTSAMKLVGKGIYQVSKDIMEGKNLGGQTIVFGLKEGGVGVPDSKLVDPAVAAATKELEQKIINEEIVVPLDKDTFDSFVSAL